MISKTRALFISGDLDGRTPRANAHDDDLLISSTQIGDEILRFLSHGGQTRDFIELPALRFGK